MVYKHGFLEVMCIMQWFYRTVSIIWMLKMILKIFMIGIDIYHRIKWYKYVMNFHINQQLFPLHLVSVNRNLLVNGRNT